MERTIFLLITLLLNVLCNVNGHRKGGDSSDSSDSDDHDGKGGHTKKIVMVILLCLVVAAIITTVVCVCYCKKKKAKLLRTNPSTDCVVTITDGGLPAKPGLPSDFSGSPNSVYNTPPSYEEVRNAPQQQGLEQPVKYPAPLYSYNQ